MRTTLTLALAASLAWSCEAADDASAEAAAPTPGDDAGQDGLGGADGGEAVSALTVQLQGVDAGALLAGTVEVQVAFTGVVERVVLLAGETIVAEQTPAAGDALVTFAWETAAISDGPQSLSAQVFGPDGADVRCEALEVEVDNTGPGVQFDLARLSVLRGPVQIAATVEEPHLAGVRLLAGEDVVAEAATAEDLALDTGAIEDGLAELRVEATDAAGNVTLSEPVLVVVANHGEEIVPEYDPEPVAGVPENYQSVEYHTRAMIPSQPDIRRVITWLTWDPTNDWLMEYTLGEGLCPHRGIAFTAAESSTGEIILDLARVDLAALPRGRLPAGEQDSETFPYNADPATFGSFFGHIAPLEPADHVGDSVPVEAHFVLFH